MCRYLPTQKGQPLTVFDSPEEGWLKGEINGRVGLFPANYVRIFEGAESQQTHRAVPSIRSGIDQQEDIEIFRESLSLGPDGTTQPASIAISLESQYEDPKAGMKAALDSRGIMQHSFGSEGGMHSSPESNQGMQPACESSLDSVEGDTRRPGGSRSPEQHDRNPWDRLYSDAMKNTRKHQLEEESYRSGLSSILHAAI